MEPPKLLKAKKSYDAIYKKASKCRHEKCQISCLSCNDAVDCEIRYQVTQRYAKLKTIRGY